MPSDTQTFSLSGADLQYVADQAESDLLALKGSHILLTGCTSFFGKWLIDSLIWADSRLNLGLRLTALSRNPERFLSAMPHLSAYGQLSFLSGDISSFAAGHLSKVSHIIHAANLPNDGRPDWPLRHMNTALDGARHVVETAAAHGCSRVLFLSSGAAYRAEPTPVPGGGSIQARELQTGPGDYLREPEVYGLTKRFTETFITALGTQYGVSAPIARCFAFAGPHMPLEGGQAIGNFVRDALAGKNIIIKGDGTPMRSYMYGADLAVWLLALLLRGRHGVPYNVGSEEAFSIKETAEEVANCAGVRISVQVLGKAVEGNAPSVYVPDTSRVRAELGLECGLSLRQSLPRTMSWFKNTANS